MISISTIYMLIGIITASLGFAIAAAGGDNSLSIEGYYKELVIVFFVSFVAILLWPITLILIVSFYIFELHKSYVKKKCFKILRSLKDTNGDSFAMFISPPSTLHLGHTSQEVINSINSIKHLKYILYASKFDFFDLSETTREHIKNRITDLSFEKTVLED